MNDVQLKQKKAELKEEMNANGYGWINGKYIKPTKEYQLLDRELWCIEMINSILCYNCRGFTKAEDVLRYEEHVAYTNYLKEDVEQLGRVRVLELIQEQIDSIENIAVGVGRDGEGLIYNSIIWKEARV